MYEEWLIKQNILDENIYVSLASLISVRSKFDQYDTGVNASKSKSGKGFKGTNLKGI